MSDKLSKYCDTCKFRQLFGTKNKPCVECDFLYTHKMWQSKEPEKVDGAGQDANSGLAINQTHYMQADVEPIEIMQMYCTPEEFQGFLKCNVIKYSLRANFKGKKQKDIDKAYQYAKWLGQAYRGEIINPKE